MSAVDAALAGDDDGSRLDSLARPVRVVVPSSSLRLHLSRALVRHHGRPVVGVVVQTLHTLAREIVEAHGEAVPGGEMLFAVLARRWAREVPALRDSLDALVDGYGPVAGTVRDLLDAGFQAVHLEPALEALEEPDDEGRPAGTRAEIDRAAALLHLTAAVLRGMEALGVGRESTLLPRAAELVAADPEGALPTRAFVVHGFADATGVAADLLDALLATPGARLILDRPPDPVEPGRSEAAFTERFAERLGGGEVERADAANTTDATDTTDAAAPTVVARHAAVGVDAEARWVAGRVRALLDAGAEPESIAVVARSLAPEQPYPRALRRHFGRLGIPFSGVGARGSLLPEGRRLRSLLDLLHQRERTPVDRWLDAARGLPETDRESGAPQGSDSAVLDPTVAASTARARRFALEAVELRLALHALGAGRLTEVAGLEPVVARLDERGLALPIRQGLRRLDGGDEDIDIDDIDEDPVDEASPEDANGTQEDRPDQAGGPNRADRPNQTGATAVRRRVSRRRLQAAVGAAGRLSAHLARWPDRPLPLGEHLEALRQLLVEDLGWDPEAADSRADAGDAAARAVFALLDELERDVPPGLELGFDEVVLLLERGLADAGRDPLGGRGGGVAVLDAIEARGRTAEHLFVVGLNRDVFPRPVREDPLLSDDLRRQLLRVLPDLPLKGRGFDEERYLFAQLLAAAERVSLSWQKAAEDGAVRPPSPLVERLGGGVTATETAGDPAPDRPDQNNIADKNNDADQNNIAPVEEHLLTAALDGDREDFARLLAPALLDLRRDVGPPGPGGGERTSQDPVRLDPHVLATAHRAILDEVDPDLSTPEGRARRAELGPWLGFVGPPGTGDPRRGDLAVTTLESLVRCPWQTFLQRLLRLEPTPDPLQALPGFTPLLVGSLVHGVLEAMVDRAREAEADAVGDAGREAPDSPGTLDATLDAVFDREPVAVPWPEDDVLDRLLVDEATALLEREGLPFPGLARALAETARPFLAAAREMDWTDGSAEVLAAELPLALGADRLPALGDGRRLRFTVDRIDRVPGQRVPTLRLTDYKTGKRPVSTAKTPKTRQEHLLRDIHRGQRLQTAVYALAAFGGRPGTTDGVGRYLFLHPELEEEHRESSLRGSARTTGDAFTEAATTLLAAWDRGAFFPRLVEPDQDREPRLCQRCPVHEACVRGDSTARRRLHDWTTEHLQSTLEGDLEPAARALLDAWILPTWKEPET